MLGSAEAVRLLHWQDGRVTEPAQSLYEIEPGQWHRDVPAGHGNKAEELNSQLALTWAAEPFLVPPADSTDAIVRLVDRALMSIPRHQAGDLVVVIAGSPPGTVGFTNMIRVHRLDADDHT